MPANGFYYFQTLEKINSLAIFRLKASMEEVQKRFLAEQKTLKDLNDKARQIEEALA